MNSKILAMIVAASICFAAVGIYLNKDSILGSTEGDLEVTDDRGVTVRFTEPFKRIASLGDPFTLVFGDLGVLDNIVLVHYYVGVVDETYPEVENIANTGVAISGDKTVLQEKIIQMNVDVVVTYNWNMAADNIEFIESELNIPVLAFSPATYGDVTSLIKDLGKICGKIDEATAISDRMLQVRNSVQEYAATLNEADRPNVYFELSTYGMKAVNYGSISDDLITTAGGVNVAADRSQSATSLAYTQEDLVDLKMSPGIDLVIVEVKSTREDSYFTDVLGEDMEILRFPLGLNSYSAKLADGLLWMLYELHGVNLDI